MEIITGVTQMFTYLAIAISFVLMVMIFSVIIAQLMYSLFDE